MRVNEIATRHADAASTTNCGDGRSSCAWLIACGVNKEIDQAEHSTSSAPRMETAALHSPRSKHPLPGQRCNAVSQQPAPALCRFFENAHHLIAESPPETARMQAYEAAVDRSDHDALLGFAFRRCSRASRTTRSRRPTSASSTSRPSEVS